MVVFSSKAFHKKETTMSASNSKNDKAEPVGNAAKDPSDWVTGDEQMTGPQASYLKTLSQEAGEEFDPELTKAEASKKIDELQHETGRGIDH